MDTTNQTGVETKEQGKEAGFNQSDVLKRANENKSQVNQENNTNSELPAQLFDRNDLSIIKDPFTRRQVEEILTKKEKDMLRGMNEKFQEAARIRKEAEGKAFDRMTHQEKLEKIGQDKSFLEFLQANGRATQDTPSEYEGTDYEWSNLSESEKNEWKVMKSELKELKQLQKAQDISRIDSELSDKIHGYDPKAVDNFLANVSQTSDKDLREMVGKALLFDQTVERVYNLGLQDRKLDIGSRLNANNNLNGTQTQLDEGLPEKKEGMSGSQFFLEIAKRNLSRFAPK